MHVCKITSLEVHEWFFLSLTRLQRVIAYLLRFTRCTKRLNNPSESLNRTEFDQALIYITISTQKVYCKDLLENCEQGN